MSAFTRRYAALGSSKQLDGPAALRPADRKADARRWRPPSADDDDFDRPAADDLDCRRIADDDESPEDSVDTCLIACFLPGFLFGAKDATWVPYDESAPRDGSAFLWPLAQPDRLGAPRRCDACHRFFSNPGAERTHKRLCRKKRRTSKRRTSFEASLHVDGVPIFSEYPMEYPTEDDVAAKSFAPLSTIKESR
ncbi:hypothetical protein M885DRAFT_615021 [Pelagophyceae sp. CCMP2097]|nr:hypothetical protein M885DRAFT_615021 [Pelagophyceae sp. CCMP2097]